MSDWTRIFLLTASLAFLAVPASAQTRADTRDALILGSSGFLAAHPDLLNRSRGWAAYEKGEHAEAMRWFKMAARYADKPSQGMVAELLWSGEGIDTDRALAYIWMDLAAERGYPNFVARREALWDALDAAEQAQVAERGQAVYAEFGDEVAKPRIAAVLRRERARTTGSRVGFVGNLRIEIPGPGGIMQSIDGSQYYADKYWDPDQYQAWHDAAWQAPRRPNVDVGELQQIGDAAAD